MNNREKTYAGVNEYLKKNPSSSIAKACKVLGFKRHDYQNHKSYLATRKKVTPVVTKTAKVIVRKAVKKSAEKKNDTGFLTTAKTILNLDCFSDAEKVSALSRYVGNMLR